MPPPLSATIVVILTLSLSKGKDPEGLHSPQPSGSFLQPTLIALAVACSPSTRPNTKDQPQRTLSTPAIVNSSHHHCRHSDPELVEGEGSRGTPLVTTVRPFSPTDFDRPCCCLFSLNQTKHKGPAQRTLSTPAIVIQATTIVVILTLSLSKGKDPEGLHSPQPSDPFPNRLSSPLPLPVLPQPNQAKHKGPAQRPLSTPAIVIQCHHHVVILTLSLSKGIPKDSTRRNRPTLSPNQLSSPLLLPVLPQPNQTKHKGPAQDTLNPCHCQFNATTISVILTLSLSKGEDPEGLHSPQPSDSFPHRLSSPLLLPVPPRSARNPRKKRGPPSRASTQKTLSSPRPT